MKKVLLAEDSPDQVKIIEALMRKAQCEVVVATDGLQAMNHLISADFDLLITDIMMPAMSGFELLQRMHEENLKVPTIVLTSKQREEDVLKGLNYGAVDYITKPFSPSVFLARVDRVLK